MLDENFLPNLIQDIATADAQQIPASAKQSYVLALQIERARRSPPAPWVWLLVSLLEKAIPIVVEYLNKRFGHDLRQINVPPPKK